MARLKPIPVYPELIDPGGPWRVEPWEPGSTTAPCPCTHKLDRRMIIPAGGSQDARDVRFHELLHVRYSPTSLAPYTDQASMMSLQAAEDARINTLGAQIRPFDPGSYVLPWDAIKFATTLSERAAAQLIIAGVGFSGSSTRVAGWSSDLTKLAKARSSTVPPWVREHAKRLRLVMNQAWRRGLDLPYRYPLDSFERCTLPIARWLDQFPDGQPGPSKTQPQEEQEYDDAVEPAGDAAAARWGTMTIETPPLSVRHPTARGRTVPSLAGARPQYWNRIPTGEVFGRPRPRGVPDAVLADQSGSMSWDPGRLHDIVGRMPVGVVAGYCGQGGRGVLKILAKDGRMVAESEVRAPYGGNEVDGPALRWLASQPGRKVWVSDQGVCSDVHQGDNGELMADCKRVIRAAGIRTCLSTDPAEIMRVLRR